MARKAVNSICSKNQYHLNLHHSSHCISTYEQMDLLDLKNHNFYIIIANQKTSNCFTKL